MKKILVTAFDPFGGEEINSSMEVLKALPEAADNIKTEKLVVPTVYFKCAADAWRAAKEAGADAILAMGQAGGRRAVAVEKRALNFANSETADNMGSIFRGVKLSETGKDEYFSTLPTEKMAEAAKCAGFDAYVSSDAGLFVCNSMLYSLLEMASGEDSGIRCAFVHLPYVKAQGKDAFSMETADAARCVWEMIKSIFREE